jgi:ATP-dependent RNA helicase RhlE
VDVLVATPGRLLDLLDQKAMHLASVEYLVLDEADQMLDLGFIHALKRIVPLVPKDRQTLFFSATMPTSIADLAGRYLTNPKKVAVAPVATTAERVLQHAVHVNQGEKQALLTVTLRDTDYNRALVFTRTKHGADKVVRMLDAAGINSAAIHGNKSQGQRTRALDDFKRGNCKVLIATDIAARGIDVDNVSHVINFDVPNVPEQYVHRIGRTARAGKDGLAMSFVAGDERVYLRDIERLTGQKIEILDLPEDFRDEVAAVKALRPVPKKGPSGNRNARGRTNRPGKPNAKPGGQKRAPSRQRQRRRRNAA